MTVLLAARDNEAGLKWEFSALEQVGSRLYKTKRDIEDSIWAANVWRDPFYLEIDSISDAAKKLKAIQRNWVLYSFDLHRRAKLIQAALPPVKAPPLKFSKSEFTILPTSPLGSWTLVKPNLILASALCSAPVPNGEYIFAEDKLTPPTRAYLKLWELFARIGTRPKKGEPCIDLGASPGGWSWVLASLGAAVTAIDRAPLDRKILSSSRITYRQGSMFSLTVDDLKKFSWVFSDAACEPEKLLNWVKSWIKQLPQSSIVCTLKFKGTGSYDIIRSFLRIEGSNAIHLYANKHEVTWYRICR